MRKLLSHCGDGTDAGHPRRSPVNARRWMLRHITAVATTKQAVSLSLGAKVTFLDTNQESETNVFSEQLLGYLVVL